MKKCNYCGRYMRNKVMNCYSCGSDNFDSIIDDKIVVIDPPKEGFHVHTEEVIQNIKKAKRLVLIGLSVLPFYLSGIICFWYPFMWFIYSYFAIQLGLVFLVCVPLGRYGVKTNKKRLNELNYLQKHGKLVKNQSYHVVNSNNNYFSLDVSFRMSDQDKATHMYSDKIFATELFQDDGLVDVLVNPENLNEHYIAFDIY